MTINLPHHIGWQLRDAARNWTTDFVARLQEAGYPGLTFALANVLGYLDRSEGVRQTEIAARTGLTKQAVGQFLDELETLGLVERIRDPDDGRARLVRYTGQGQKFLVVADHIKSDIEAEYAQKLGLQNLDKLKSLLDDLLKI